MTKKDRTNLSILVVLLVVLGLTLVLVYRMNQPPTATIAAVPTPEAASKPSANPPTANNGATIRLDLVEKSGDEGGVGKKNLFQYRQAPPPPPSPRQVTAAVSQQPFTVPQQQTVVRPPGPPPPPQPPPITLKYQGFAKSSGNGITAFIADDSRHFNVTIGEVLMGRYRIAGITDKSVEIEDLEFNRRQLLPLVK